MFLKKITLILTIAAMSQQVHANQFNGNVKLENSAMTDVNIEGSADLKNMTMRSLKINGDVHFANLKVTDKCTINGSGKGDDVFCHDIILHGSFTTQNLRTFSMVVHGNLSGNDIAITNNLIIDGALDCQTINVSGYTQIYGEMNVSGSTFNDIILTTQKSTITNSNAGNITIKAEQNHRAAQQLILKGDTIITGNIVFESGNGELHLDKEVTVKGQIYGCTKK